MVKINVVDSENLMPSVDGFFGKGCLCRELSIREETPACILVRRYRRSMSLVKSSKAEILLVKWPAREFSKMSAVLSILAVKILEARSKALFGDGS